MSTTFLDPPGPLANTYEALDFTTDRVATSISVEFHPELGNGPRETVWDGTSDTDDSGGNFSYLYRASTRTGSGPYTWHIVREGAWPASLRIRVKEVSSVAAPALLPADATAVAQYSFDGVTTDYSGNGRDLVGSPKYCGDIIVGHLALRNSLLQLPSTPETPFEITGDLTVMFRYWDAAVGNRQFLAGSILNADTPGCWGVEISSSGNARFRSSNGVNVESNLLAPSYYAHYTFRRVSNVVTINIDDQTPYVSGVLAAPGSSGVMRVLGEVTAPFTQGGMTNLNIWARGLSDAEVLARRKIMMGV